MKLSKKNISDLQSHKLNDNGFDSSKNKLKLYDGKRKKIAIQEKEEKKQESTNKGNYIDKDKLININPKFASEVTLIMGKRGFGKSYTAGVITEQLYNQDIQFIFFDTQNANQGLAELEDIKLVSTKSHDPKQLAEELLSTKQSCVIRNDTGVDKTGLWFAKFLNIYQNYNLKGVRTIIIDEIHLLAPNKKETYAGREIKTLITTKRSDGIGVIMITQRPAEMNTTCVTQADNVFIHRLSGLRDLDIARELLSYEMPEKNQVDTILSELRDFKQGQVIAMVN